MHLSFFTKIFGRSVQLSSSFDKRSPTLGTLVSTKTKCIKLIFIGKITLVPVAFLMALSIFSWAAKPEDCFCVLTPLTTFRHSSQTCDFPTIKLQCTKFSYHWYP